jgi:L-ribulose-5-phosphate 3-epimerase
MFLGYNTNGFAHHRLEDAILILAELGYRGIGLTLDVHHYNPFGPRENLRASFFRALLGENNLHAVVETGARFLLDPRRKHQPTLLDPDPIARGVRLDFLTKAIHVAARVSKDSTVSFWSGAPVDNAPPRELMNRLVDCCRALCALAEPEGVEPNDGVRLAFEPEPGMFIDTMDKFAELYERVNHPQFGLTLDIGHLQCQGELPIGDHIRRWKDILWNVHIEDMKRGVHDHLMFGEGEIDFADVFSALRDIKYQHGVYVELSRHSHNAVETARRSLEFLRQYVT